MQDARRRLWQLMPGFPDTDARHDWLEEQCVAQWSDIQHGGLPGTLADLHAAEVGSLMPLDNRVYYICGLARNDRLVSRIEN